MIYLSNHRKKFFFDKPIGYGFAVQCTFGHNNNVRTYLEVILILPEKTSQNSFNPVPDDCRPLLSAHGKAQTNPAGAATMTQHKEYKTPCEELFSLLIAEIKFRLSKELVLLFPT